MSKSPTCPNCARPMHNIDGRDEKPVLFECQGCKVILFTHDHIGVTGLPADKHAER